MDIDKIIKDKEPIYYKHMGPVQEFRIVKKIELIPDVDISDLSDELKERVSRHTGTYLALQDINNDKNSEFYSVDTFVSCWWEDHLKLKSEKDANKKGTSLIGKFFNKYGVFNERFDKPNGIMSQRSFGSSILYDGYPTPNHIWNTDIKTAYVGFYMDKHVNNYIKRYGEVWKGELRFELGKEDLMDTESANSVRRCHYDTNLENEKRYTQNYQESDWQNDIDLAIDIYMDHLSKVINDEPIQVSKHTNMYYQPSNNFILCIGDTNFYTHEFTNTLKTKYRNAYCEISKTPIFNDTISKEELMQSVLNHVKSKSETVRNIYNSIKNRKK